MRCKVACFHLQELFTILKWKLRYFCLMTKVCFSLLRNAFNYSQRYIQSNAALHKTYLWHDCKWFCNKVKLILTQDATGCVELLIYPPWYAIQC